MKISFIKVYRDGATGLYPNTDEGIELFFKIPDGTELILDIKRSRNPKFHRYAMAMLNRLHDMADDETAFNPWRKWLTIKAGYFSVTGFPDGSSLVEADSLSFESMSEEKFQQVWKDLHQAFCRIYGQKITYDELTEWSVM